MKPVGIVGYSPRHFHKCFDYLRRHHNYDIHWIINRPSWKEHATKVGIPKENIVYIDSKHNQGGAKSLQHYIEKYPLLNTSLSKMINSDRLFRNLRYERQEALICNWICQLEEVFKNSPYLFLTSGRDTVLQQLTGAVTPSFDMSTYYITYSKLPPFRYGVTARPVPNEFIDLDIKLDEDSSNQIDAFLNGFQKRGVGVSTNPSFGPQDFLRRLVDFFKFYCAMCLDHRLNFGYGHVVRSPIALLHLQFIRLINRVLQRYSLDTVNSIPDPDSNYIFTTIHKQPESSIDVAGSDWTDQYYFIKRIRECLPMEHALYVKLHPDDVGGQPIGVLKKISTLPNTFLVGPGDNSLDWLRNSYAVVTNTGAIGLEAGLSNKPCVAFANVFWTKLPTVEYCSDIKDMYKLITQLEKKSKKNNDGGVRSYLEDIYSRTVPGLPNRAVFREEMSIEDFESVAKLMNRIEAIKHKSSP